MVATKVTNLFHSTTVDPEGNGKRIAGWSESFYTPLEQGSSLLGDNWTQLCRLRAALMPKNVTIVGGRWQQVDPVGPVRSFDTTFVGTSNAANDLPSMALQWTVRAIGTPNQRSVILRGVPDDRIVTGEYKGSAAYDAALIAYFRHLTGFWNFRAIRRTLLPFKVVSISVLGVVTLTANHNFAVGDTVRFMSVVRDNGKKWSDDAIVTDAPAGRTFTIFVPRLGRDDPLPLLLNSSRGRVRKVEIFYPGMSILQDEIVSPVAITRKAGSPFRKFRGRRTARR